MVKTENKDCCEVFRERWRQALCGCEELLDYLLATETVIMTETGREVFGVSS